MPWYRRLFKRAEQYVVRPGDSAEDRLRKTVLLLFGVAILLGVPLDAAVAFSAGAHGLGLLLFVTSLLVGLAIAHMRLTGRRLVLQYTLFGIVLSTTALAHVWLGRSGASHGILVWGSLVPLAALLLCPRREAVAWLLIYCFIATGLVVVEPSVAFEPLEKSETARVWLDLSAQVIYVSCVFGLLYYFIGRLRAAGLELEVKHALLTQEQERSESLLLNVLPRPIVDRLKDSTGTIADGFEEISVLFADIVGFTELAARLEPQKLVQVLNELFSRFDELAERHAIEKIKTIGDAYMAACGLPDPSPEHASSMADMALDMLDTVARFNEETGHELSVRIGINTGPVVAGVIGRKRFIYDLWGDTVNVASRMESHGEKGCIQVTGATRALLMDRYDMRSRGDINVKGRGLMETWFLLRRS